MKNLPNLYLIIDFRDSNLEYEELEFLTNELFLQVDLLEEVELVERIREQPTEEVKAGKGLGKFLAGILATQLSLPNIVPVVKFITSRLKGSIKIEVVKKEEDREKTIRLEANGSSQEEVLALIKELREFAQS